MANIEEKHGQGQINVTMLNTISTIDKRRSGGIHETTVEFKKMAERRIIVPSADQSAKRNGRSQDVVSYAEMMLPLAGPSNGRMEHKNCYAGYIEPIYGQFDHDKVMGRDPTKASALQSKKKRKDMGDPADDSFRGPWAGFEEEPEPGTVLYGLTDLDRVTLEHQKAARKTQKHSRELEQILPGQERSIFHALNERDFLGRTYMSVPNESTLQMPDDWIPDPFVPKKLLHEWRPYNRAEANSRPGASKTGINSITVLPVSGHLLLSASMDAKIKLWDVYRERKILRTFIGHDKAVKCVNFAALGEHFYSAAYDKMVKFWDTETGSCKWNVKLKGLPHCLAVHPTSPTTFIVGCSNHRIYQYDTREPPSESLTNFQEYNEHLEAVNALLFIDEGRRFVSTSDDKSIRFWEFGIPVTIKTIAEPHMHAINSLALHPNGKVFAAQSQDNQILTYTTGGAIRDVESGSSSTSSSGADDRFRLYKKRFAGHITAGYGCQVSFSPDGQYVLSGDSMGKLWFWNWKTGKILKNFKAHDKVLMNALWLPKESSKVITASWDGFIKLWD